MSGLLPRRCGTNSHCVQANRIAGVLALACSIACGATASHAPTPRAGAASDAELRAHVVRQLALLPPAKGAVVVGVFDGRRETVLGFGAVSAADRRTPDGHTVFEICSIT